jgi:hypothetical protein
MTQRTIWCDECGTQFSSELEAVEHESCMPQLTEGDPIEFEYFLLTETGKFQKFGPKVGPNETRIAYVKSDRVIEEPESPFHTGYDYFVPAKDVRKQEVAANAA